MPVRRILVHRYSTTDLQGGASEPHGGRTGFEFSAVSGRAKLAGSTVAEGPGSCPAAARGRL
jgi:hypothetical protein